MLDGIDDYEDVAAFALDEDILERLLAVQNEACFIWGPKNHWAVGVMMSYVWKDGSFWLTATSQRKRIAAIKRDPRVSVVVSSAGTPLGMSKTVTAKGRVTLHTDQATKDWFYPALAAVVVPNLPDIQQHFISHLDSPRRVIIEVVPEKWITFDAMKMMAASAASALPPTANSSAPQPANG